MTPTRYESELEQLRATYGAARSADVGDLKLAIAAASESSIISVGSGGSFTVASLLCNLHETYTGRVSRPATPLEIICNPTLSSTSPIFFVSAEGKNPDIVEALSRARLHSARAAHIITNRSSSPLIEIASHLTDVRSHVFELANKDGYLATNSLLLNAMLVARAYGELNREPDQVPNDIERLHLNSISVDAWLKSAVSFAHDATSRGALIVVFSPQLRPVAADLESKLAESALLHCQLADLRSFAHGRHLWLAERPDDCAILALVEPSLAALWQAMHELLPSQIPTLTMAFAGAKPQDLLAGLVAQMKFVSLVAQEVGKDPGKPVVPHFGRDLHYLKLPDLIPPPSVERDHGERAKTQVLGAHWPTSQKRSAVYRAQQAFQAEIAKQSFRAIVFDYDGTLCPSGRRVDALPAPVVSQLSRLISGKVLVGIASGRGGSIKEQLQASLQPSQWRDVQLGLYNCGLVTNLEDALQETTKVSEFLSHVARVVGKLRDIGVPIAAIKTTQPFQVSVRFQEGVNAERSWFVVADALRQAGLDPLRVVHSRHSVDILADGINKSLLIAHMVQRFKVHPYDVLTVGDRGAWPGNDASLLDHRFSLSVDVPSRRLERGWNLAPANKRNVDATLWYLERVEVQADGRFFLNLAAP